MIKKFFYFLLIFLFIGCTNSTNLSKDTLIKKVNKSNKIQKNYSKWNEAKKIPLKIVAIGYINPAIKKSIEYKRFINTLKLINKNTKILNKIVGFKITEKFYPIKVVDFEKDNNLLKFNAAYEKRFDDKEVLTDILRPTNEHPSAEILFRINYDKLKKGILQIEGYKTIKIKGKIRNSCYYYLINKDYKKLNDTEKKEAIINSIRAAIQLSIPSYISINTQNNKKPIKILTQLNKTKFQGVIYKPKKLEKWQKVNKILLYTSPISKKDLNILYETKYIHFNKDSHINKNEIQELINSLNRSFLDPLLAAIAPNSIENLSNNYMQTKKGVILVYKKNYYNLNEILTSSKSPLHKNKYNLIYQNSKFTKQDIKNGFAFPVINYASKYQNPRFNKVFVQFKNYKVINITQNIIMSEQAKNLLKTKNIDTLFYKNRKFTNIYPYNVDGNFRILFIPNILGKCVMCNSQFYSIDWTLTPIINLGIITLGSYAVKFDPSLIKRTNFRPLEQFKSEKQ